MQRGAYRLHPNMKFLTHEGNLTMNLGCSSFVEDLFIYVELHRGAGVIFAVSWVLARVH